MNSITRLILRHVVSGKVKLTPRLFEEMKRIEQNQPVLNTPERLAPESSSPPNHCPCGTATKKKSLKIGMWLRSRRVRGTGCAVGIAFFVAASSDTPSLITSALSRSAPTTPTTDVHFTGR